MTDLKKVSENMEAVLILSEQQYKNLLKHLLPKKSWLEECAFLFVDAIFNESKVEFIYKDSYCLMDSDYKFRSGFHFELKDSTKAMIIKKSHDLGCCIVEAHSHNEQRKAEFSSSDWSGFNDFVPHVLWRLKGKPYLSLVFTLRNFDAIVWVKDFRNPTYLNGIQVDSILKKPTGISINNRQYEK